MNLKRPFTATARFLATFMPTLWAGVTIGAGFVAVPAVFAGLEAEKPAAYAATARIFERLATAEWIAVAVLIIALAALRARRWRMVAMAVLLVLLVLQAAWLRPELIARAATLATGGTVPPSSAHAIFASLETLKLALLAWLAYASGRTQQPAPSKRQSSA